MRTRTTLLLLAATLLAVPQLSAQRWSGDLRGAVASPTMKLAGAELQTGFGFGMTIAYRVQPHLHLYGGWDWMHFAADQSFAGADMDFEETGYTFGLRFQHPFQAGSAHAYRLEAGGTYKHNELENSAGDLVVNSGHGLGYEAGAGVLFALQGSWNLSPTLRYRSLTRDYDVAGARTSGTLRYLALEVGFSRGF
ncbi:MAG TPA: outer membrane beta-barrel protein [Gemmatimonadaceae bacterium]|nr:outer membrane beta-barrel protein [Gemmatimonadaceae bacterium]